MIYTPACKFTLNNFLFYPAHIAILILILNILARDLWTTANDLRTRTSTLSGVAFSSYHFLQISIAYSEKGHIINAIVSYYFWFQRQVRTFSFDINTLEWRGSSCSIAGEVRRTQTAIYWFATGYIALLVQCQGLGYPTGFNYTRKKYGGRVFDRVLVGYTSNIKYRLAYLFLTYSPEQTRHIYTDQPQH